MYDDRFFSHLEASTAGGAKKPWFKCTVTLLKGENGILQGGDSYAPYCSKCKIEKRVLVEKRMYSFTQQPARETTTPWPSSSQQAHSWR